jgi:uncharacterized protein
VISEDPERLLEELVAAAERGDEEAGLSAAKRCYAAFIRGEISLDSPAVDPELVWEPPTNAPTAGAYKGPSAAEAEVQAWTEPFDDFTWEPKRVILARDRFVVIGDMRGRGRGSGVEVAQEESHVWTLRDGRIVRMQMFLDRDEALAAAAVNQRA